MFRALLLPISLMCIPLAWGFAIMKWRYPARMIYKFCEYTWNGLVALLAAQWSAVFWIANFIRTRMAAKNAHRKNHGGDA